MPLRLPLGNRQLHIGWLWLWVAVIACVVFVELGRWQWDRGRVREQQWLQIQAALTMAPRPMATAAALASQERYTRVRLSGTWLADRQVLLDNLSRDGKPGYEVLTPLQLADGGMVLVNRGWVAFDGYRDRLPDVALSEVRGAELSGRLDVLPVAGIRSAVDAAALVVPTRWPAVASFPTAAQLSAWLAAPLTDRVLLLDADSGPGWRRDWPLPGLAPQRHYAYAIQWWSFAALALGLLVGLNLRKRT